MGNTESHSTAKDKLENSILRDKIEKLEKELSAMKGECPHMISELSILLRNDQKPLPEISHQLAEMGAEKFYALYSNSKHLENLDTLQEQEYYLHNKQDSAGYSSLVTPNQKKLKLRFFEKNLICVFGIWGENDRVPSGPSILIHELEDKIKIEFDILGEEKLLDLRNKAKGKNLENHPGKKVIHVEATINEKKFMPNGNCATLCAYSDKGDFAFYKYGLGGKIQWKQNKIEEEFTCGKSNFYFF